MKSNYTKIGILMITLLFSMTLTTAAVTNTQISSTSTSGEVMECQSATNCVITNRGGSFFELEGTTLFNRGSTPTNAIHRGYFLANPGTSTQYDIGGWGTTVSSGTWQRFLTTTNNVTSEATFTPSTIGGTQNPGCIMYSNIEMFCIFGTTAWSLNDTVGEIAFKTGFNSLTGDSTNQYVTYDGTFVYTAAETQVDFMVPPLGAISQLSQPTEDNFTRPILDIKKDGSNTVGWIAQDGDTEIWYYNGATLTKIGDISGTAIRVKVIDAVNKLGVLITTNTIYGLTETTLQQLDTFVDTITYAECAFDQDTCFAGTATKLFKITNIESSITTNVTPTPPDNNVTNLELALIDFESLPLTTLQAHDMVSGAGLYLYIVSESTSGNGLLHSMDLTTSSLGTDIELQDFGTSFNPRSIDWDIDFSSTSRIVMGADQGIIYIPQAGDPGIVSLQTPVTATVFSPMTDTRIMFINDTHTVVAACGTTGTGLPGDPLNSNELVIVEIIDNGTTVIFKGIQPIPDTECLSLDYDKPNNLLWVNTGKTGSTGVELYELTTSKDDFTLLDNNTIHLSSYNQIFQSVQNIEGGGTESSRSGQILASVGRSLLFDTNLGPTNLVLNFTCNSPSSSNEVFAIGDLLELPSSERTFMLHSLTTTEPAFDIEACEIGNATSGTAIQVFSEVALGGQEVTFVEHPTRVERTIALTQSGDVRMFELQENITALNQIPTISLISVSNLAPQLNEPVTVIVTANDPDGDNDFIRYALECEGTPATPTGSFQTGDDEFTCVFTTSGTKIIRAYVTDEQHSLSDFNILDKPGIIVENTTFTDDFIRFRVFELDVTTGLADNIIAGVNVTPTGLNLSQVCDTPTCPLTDAEGFIQFRFVNGTNLTNILTSFTKTGFSSEFIDASPSSAVIEVVMIPIGGATGGDASLTVTVLVTNTNTPVAGALVSVTDPLTGESTFDFTASNGVVSFGNPPTSTTILVNVDQLGLQFTSQQLSLLSGQTKSITIFTDTALTEIITDRGCKDVIREVWLCNATNACTNNADCAGDLCGASGFCSSFNFKKCDDSGLSRGNRCIISKTFTGGLNEVFRFSLNNFFLVLVLLALIVGFVMIKQGLSRN